MTNDVSTSKPKPTPFGREARPASGKRIVNYAKIGHVAVLELDDPPANTYTHEMLRQLDEAILDARFDVDVEAIVLAAAGEKFFCAGANIAMLDDVSPSFKYMFCLHANETLSRLEQTPKLVIAALSGHTVGGGLEIAMAADLRIARRGAGKIGLPEVALGVLPGTGGTQRLTRLVGKARALELLISGRTFAFEEAKELGIVTDIFDGDAAQFRAQVLAYAGGFTSPHKAPLAVGFIKRSVQSGAEIPLEYGLALERELQSQLFKSDDAKEGIAAFGERREPEFKNR